MNSYSCSYSYSYSYSYSNGFMTEPTRIEYEDEYRDAEYEYDVSESWDLALREP